MPVLPTVSSRRSNEGVDEEHFGGELALGAGQFMQESTGSLAHSTVALHGERHQLHAAVFAQRIVPDALDVMTEEARIGWCLRLIPTCPNAA